MKRILFVLFLFCAYSGSQTAVAQSQENRVIVNADQAEYEISEHIYGQFSEHLGRGIYGGIWVGEDSDIPNTEGYRTDVLKALQELEIPNIRWPGGCFADEYDWRDGIGPRSERPKTVNTHWGMVIEDNSFGTHEFLRLTELLGAEPYISANVGSGTPAEMQDWIEYMTFDGDSELANLRRKNGREEPWDIKFFGIGNESWGCGGNMTADYYADLYRRYQTYAKDYSGNELYKIASGWSNDEYDWTETVMREAHWMMDAISLHYYTIPGPSWGNKGPSTGFGEDLYFDGLQASLELDRFIEGHDNRMDKFDPEQRVALAVDEWGVWTDPLPGSTPGFLEQQNSMRDALIASLSLDILNSHADRVRIANIAQTVNVLQAMILTDGEQMIKTPTYHVFHMYKVHQNAMLLPIDVESTEYSHNGESIPSVSTTVSRDDDGVIHITASNTHASESQEVAFDLRGTDVDDVIPGRLLTADSVNSINTFEDPDNVSPVSFEDATLEDGTLTMTLPPRSIVVLGLE
ncbi:alpha-N-arabinofuranosidase [Aliifodinibius sp. S!AR15-10]|uniref:alpha-N-arabinofuranosidase n=1 Tax=Aliifodinibius sp. S!AR15-10 TaxID=2950437 RepID=UPI00285C57F3|nr:alpha-N-arabinofuranosidase [Aliifodinibius sp. S!AR15-10]MDR8393135.1 alpha-N-arabinofuranosidase [Aliifodinibius sp. S!AR15-10]